MRESGGHARPPRKRKSPNLTAWSFGISVLSLIASGLVGGLTYCANRDMSDSTRRSADDSHQALTIAQNTFQIQSEPVLLLDCEWIPDPDNGDHAFNWRHTLHISLTQTVELINNMSGSVTQMGPISMKNKRHRRTPQPAVFINRTLSNHGPLLLINLQLGNLIPEFLTGPSLRGKIGNRGSIAEILVLEHGQTQISILNVESVMQE